MIIKKQQSGYIMIVTIIIISLLTALVTYLINRSTPFIAYTNIAIEREKAKNLALGGIQMAMSQLAWAAAEPEGKKKQTTTPSPDKEKKEEPGEQDKRFLETILPVINRWQNITLTETQDGVEGEISFVIMSEQGKIDINQLYDFENKKFIGERKLEEKIDPKDKDKKEEVDYKKFTQELFKLIEKQSGAQKLFDAFATFLKNRDYKLNDVTELLTIKAFEPFKNKLYYIPPEPGKQPTPQQQQKAQLYLTDIFTVSSGRKTIEPWLLSDSMCGLLNLEQVKAGDTEKRTANVKKWLEKFKLKADWEKDWDTILAPAYGKKFNVIPKFFIPVLATTFGPTVFSVLSYGKTGEVTQRLLAILEKGKPSQEHDGRAPISIKKLYWL